jgi:hypothetical protein
MEQLPLLRSLIQRKLDDGRLPRNSIPRVWGGAGNGETCDACEETITKKQIVMEGVGAGKKAIQFHVSCFSLWDELRGDRGVVCTFCGKRIATTQEQSRIQGEPFHDTCWDQMQKRP